MTFWVSVLGGGGGRAGSGGFCWCVSQPLELREEPGNQKRGLKPDWPLSSVHSPAT